MVFSSNVIISNLYNYFRVPNNHETKFPLFGLLILFIQFHYIFFTFFNFSNPSNHSIPFFFNHFFNFPNPYTIYKISTIYTTLKFAKSNYSTSIFQIIFKPFQTICKPFFSSQKWDGMAKMATPIKPFYIAIQNKKIQI